jgi:SulP family sulfate permease
VSAPEVAAHEARPGLVQRYLPILHWLPTYRRDWFTPDAVAALSVWALLIPQGLAYATIAGVPVQYGLYTAFVGLLAYAIFGTSGSWSRGQAAPWPRSRPP